MHRTDAIFLLFQSVRSWSCFSHCAKMHKIRVTFNLVTIIFAWVYVDWSHTRAHLWLSRDTSELLLQVPLAPFLQCSLGNSHFDEEINLLIVWVTSPLSWWSHCPLLVLAFPRSLGLELFPNSSFKSSWIQGVHVFIPTLPVGLFTKPRVPG